MNVYRWRNNDVNTVDDASFRASVQAKLSAAFAFLAGDLHNSLDAYDIRFDKVAYVAGKETVTEAWGTFTWTLSTPPAGGGEGLPPMDAAVINFRTTQPGSFGRKYIGVMSENVQADGTIIGAVTGHLGQYATELLTALASGGSTFDLGAFSEKVGYVGSWLTFSAAVINSILGTQRRRRKNVGS